MYLLLVGTSIYLHNVIAQFEMRTSINFIPGHHLWVIKDHLLYRVYY